MIILAILGTGIRRGEIIGLKWSVSEAVPKDATMMTIVNALGLMGYEDERRNKDVKYKV
jgi:hypothetical protein